MNTQQISELYNFRGETVAITGGAGVLGFSMVKALAGLGANVVILDRLKELPEPLQQQLAGLPGEVALVTTDVLKKEALLMASETVKQRFGAASMLINGAGGNKPTATTSADLSFFDLPEEALRFVFDLNILGTILPSQVFGAAMAATGKGIILNISSMNAFRPLTRIPAYSAAKAGVSNFTQWLAVHMAQNYSPHIRVNAIAPGFFLTEQNRFLLTEKESGELTPRGNAIINHLPMGRFGEPEDLLGTMLWLLSPASAYVTGVVIPVDGGFSAFSGV